MTGSKSFLTGVVAVVSVLASLAGRGEGTNAASLACPESKFEFGQVYPGAVVKHRFVLTNQCDRPVRIQSVHTTCGCAQAVASSTNVAPGQIALLDVEMNFKGRRGHQSKAVYVETDDPVNRIIRVEFDGIVIVPIELQPEGIHFGTLATEGTAVREVLVTAVGTNEFRVKSVTASSTQVLASLETLEAGKRYRVKITSEGPRSLGSAMSTVRVETDNPLMTTLDIPVAAFVAGDIVPAPGTLLLIPSVTNEPRSSWVNLWSPSGKAFKITRVEMPGDGMTNTVRVLTPDRSRIEVKTWGALTELDGKTLRVHTDLASMKEVLIPLRVIAMPAKDQPPPGP